MLELFNEYKNSNQITDALLIGRNLFNRNPDNQEVFSAYFDLLCSLAENLPLLSERKSFMEQADVALAFFSENAELDRAILSSFHAYQERLGTIQNAILSEEQKSSTAQANKIQEINNQQIKKIYTIRDNLRKADTQEEFDRLLAELSAADRAIDKDMLSEKQANQYDALTKTCTEAISKKMQELECKSNMVYNKKAIEAYARAFRACKNDESLCKNWSRLSRLASETLFAFEASRLFNETLIYYNHIYSYIFNKLDDDGKLALTGLSVDCERKLRS